MANKKFRPRAPEEGYVFLVAPANVTSCAVHGIEYQVNEEGVVEIPTASAPWLLDHGFSYAVAPDA